MIEFYDRFTVLPLIRAGQIQLSTEFQNHDKPVKEELAVPQTFLKTTYHGSANDIGAWDRYSRLAEMRAVQLP
jgi:hypothetical protein